MKNSWLLNHRTLVAVGSLVLLLVILIFTDVLPIGYKQVTYPQEVDYTEMLKIQNKALPVLTCPKPSSTVKLNYHVPAERAMYNEPSRATQCPTYHVTELLYW